MLVVLVGSGLVLVGLPAVYGQEDEEEKAEQEELGTFVLEEVVVTSERGETMVLDRAMTVTGFNEQMVEQLGIQNEGDLEVLVPGLQVGNRTQGGGKSEDDHYYMRGIGSERTVNFFSDTAVAVYVDGVWTDQTYGTDGFFDVERVEVARGPQGTTGGKAALSGSISFHSRKPTDTFDVIGQLEFTDQFTQHFRLAFGGPIMDTDFSYRLRYSRLVGDGQIENVYPGARDGGEPDQTIISPQLRWKTDRWDVTLRYSDQRDVGTPMVSLALGARDTVNEFQLSPVDGTPICNEHPITGEVVCRRNPYFGADAAPSVAGCSNISLDGTRDPQDIICNPDELRHKVALNAPIFQDNSAKAGSIDALFDVSNSLVLNYKGGWRHTITNNLGDDDQLPREGGGVCLWDHPKVLGGMLTEGEVSPYCALDGGGDGSFANSRSEYEFSSEQYSHEISLYSNFDGPFNFTLGAVYIDGQEPYDWRGYNFGSTAGKWLYEDTSAQCEAVIESLYGAGGLISGAGSRLLRDFPADANAAAAPMAWTTLVACPGSPEILHQGAGTNYTANPNGQTGLFTGNVKYRTIGAYLNVEFAIGDSFRVFGGLRDDEDTKSHPRNDYWYSTGVDIAEPTVDWGAWGIFENGCENDTGEDCFGIIHGWPRNASGTGFEGKREFTWGKTTWNVGAEYSPNDDVMLYGRISTGYRAGGFYGFAVSEPPWGMPAEEMTNYETGIKGLFFDNVLQLELSYFYQDFESYWVFSSRLRTPQEMLQDPDAGPITGEIDALDGTTIGGIELQGAWRISDSFIVRGFYNWLDASIGNFNSIYPWGIPNQAAEQWRAIDWTDSQGNPQQSWVNDSAWMEYGGNQLPNQPEHKGSMTLAYETPLPESLGSLEVLTTYNYTGKKYIELGNFDAYAIDPYHRWDIRGNWRSPGQKLTVTLYVQNLLDQAGLYLWSPREGMSSPWGTVVEPREIGLSITWRN